MQETFFICKQKSLARKQLEDVEKADLESGHPDRSIYSSELENACGAD